MHDTQIEVVKQYQCRHIFIDGRRCGSPCVRQEEFCYYHHTFRKPITDPRGRRSRRSTFQLPLPEDRSAIQSSIGEVLQRIASNDIDPRRAGLLLYGLQIASLNLAQSRTATKTSAEHETVEEISIDPTLGILAPRAELAKSTTRKSPVLQLIEEIIQSEQKEADAARSTVLPTLQAAEGTIPWDQAPIRSRTDVTFLDYPDYELNALGARGVGEIGLAGIAAAITNAVYHATGIRVRDLPIRIEDLLIPASQSMHVA